MKKQKLCRGPSNDHSCAVWFQYSNIVDIPRVRTSTYGKNSFKYAAAVLWNDLPDDFRKIANFNQFKNILLSCICQITCSYPNIQCDFIKLVTDLPNCLVHIEVCFWK